MTSKPMSLAFSVTQEGILQQYQGFSAPLQSAREHLSEIAPSSLVPLWEQKLARDHRVLFEEPTTAVCLCCIESHLMISHWVAWYICNFMKRMGLVRESTIGKELPNEDDLAPEVKNKPLYVSVDADMSDPKNIEKLKYQVVREIKAAIKIVNQVSGRKKVMDGYRDASKTLPNLVARHHHSLHAMYRILLQLHDDDVNAVAKYLATYDNTKCNATEGFPVVLLEKQLDDTRQHLNNALQTWLKGPRDRATYERLSLHALDCFHALNKTGTDDTLKAAALISADLKRMVLTVMGDTRSTNGERFDDSLGFDSYYRNEILLDHLQIWNQMILRSSAAAHA